MNQAINTCITGLNNIGQGFCNYAVDIFIQSSVLIILLLIIDFLLRKRGRAIFRYCLWMLVFIKLIMPASFTLPTGIGYWMGDYFSSEASLAKWIPQPEEIVPTTLDINQGLIPLEPVVTNETAVIDIHQDLLPSEPVMTNETAVTGIELETICWQGWVFLGWLGGMLVLLALLVQRICFVTGLIAQGRPANKRLLDMLDECCCQMGIRQNIELRLSDNTFSPAVCGLFKPMILIPAKILEKLSREKLKTVLIHELAHIKRADVCVSLVQTMLQIVYFYNPLVWLANVMIRRVREQAVDEMVLVTLKPETKNYSNTLIDIAEMAFRRTNFSLRLIGVVESKKALEMRIKHMLNRPVPKNSKLGSTGLIAIIVTGIILLPMGSNFIAEAANTQEASREHSETYTIVPGVRVGEYKLGMSKDEVLKRLRKTKGDSLPKAANSISADGIILNFIDDSVNSIDVLRPLYKFTNGLGIGDSEQKIKQSFGNNFHLKETQGKDFLTYKDEGLVFEIHKNSRMVMEITVTKKISLGHGRTLVKPIKSVKPYDDVRWKDLSKLDLSRDRGLIHSLTFNKLTVWPEQAKMPPGGDPKKILTDALNPGLGVRELHQQGITGKGVNVAIIDQPVYLVHPEFAGKIAAYHDTGCETDESSMHGPLVTSLLVGTNCGTAPDARVYYAAAPSWKADAAYYAKGLDWIIAQNKKLPEEEKIRVVSVSASPNQSSWANRQMWDRACARAEADGIMVLDCTNSSHRGFIGRCWYNARVPDSVAQCNPGSPPNREFRLDPADISLLVPSSPRTAAEDGDLPGYQYAGRGGLSRAIPYCAGVLAMGWQVRPELHHQQMRELLFKSAFTDKNGAKIIYPKKFISMAKIAKATPRQNQRQKISREQPETKTIMSGLQVGDYKLGMSKDEVLKSLRKTKGDSLRETGNSISADGIIFNIIDDSVTSIAVLSPLYKFANGLGIGSSEQKIKQTFGNDFLLNETEWKDFLIYKNRGLQFEIHKKNRTVMEFSIIQKNSRGPGGSSAKSIESVKPYDDVRWKDLSKLDLSAKRGLIKTLTFNKKTVWPEQAKMPPGSGPQKILTDAMNPGLGVRQLHQQGITGKGVNVAIIDQPTYLVHPEFAGKIVAYHDTGCETDDSSMHGPGVASLLVGTNCGTAPGARVHYVAAPSWKRDAAYYAKGLDWIITQNKKLPEGEKIRVVSVSASPNQSSWANRQMWDRACARAEADGIMVLDCTDSRRRGFIGRCWYNARAPESIAQCNPWAPPNREFRFNPGDMSILVPSAPRTTAEDGEKDKLGYRYQYCGRGGLSWAIPYCAGVLAMGWQVNPELSPEQMRELLYKSAYTKRNGAKIIYPKKFILLARRAKSAPRTK